MSTFIKSADFMRCDECRAHWLDERDGLTHAFASVGIEAGLTTPEMAERYFASYHKRGHQTLKEPA